MYRKILKKTLASLKKGCKFAASNQLKHTTMKYYQENIYGHKTEISKSKFYSLARRKDAHITIHTNNGIKVAKSVKIK